MIPFYVICGFLGSGKTTLIGKVLQHYAANVKVAVIQNEFAPSGIDGRDLKRRGYDFQLLEINNGSVFCVCQLSNFVALVEQLATNHHPDMILLETSGLADPINVIELLQVPAISDRVRLARIITLVDAPNYERGLGTLPRFRHQLMIADTLIVNKIDLYKKDLAVLISGLQDLNPFAAFYNTSYCLLPIEKIMDTSGNFRAAERYLGKKSEGSPKIRSVVLRSHRKCSPAELDNFLKQLSLISIRFKGFVKMEDGNHRSVQGVFGQYRSESMDDYAGGTEIVAFGSELTPGKLKELYHRA